jgi:plasmid stabilization system protein ParE
MAFSVRQTAQADSDLDAILEWLLAREAGEAGLRWLNGLQESLQSLSESPYRCVIAPENSVFPFEVRQLLYGRKPHVYRVLFTVDKDSVIILHIRHGRQLRISRFVAD